MKKRMLIFTIGLMLGVAVTGCENNENAESSLESLVESTEEESTEVETETDNKRMTPPYTTAPLPGEDGCGLRKPPEIEFDFEEAVNQETYPSPEWVGAPKSPEMMKEEAKKETIFGTVDQESEYVIKAEGDEWIDNCEPSKLPETPYNKKLDEIFEDRIEAGCGFLWNEENRDGEYYHKWIDCGMYYKIKDVDIVCFYDSEFGGMDYDIIGHFDELYVMKEGEYIFNGVAYTNFNDWLKNNFYLTPKFRLTFDEKGYIVGCMDVAVS